MTVHDGLVLNIYHITFSPAIMKNWVCKGYFMLQASKKLKMEEKDMREAKSVLKHKMADMLNVLHPDTSNEAS